MVELTRWIAVVVAVVLVVVVFALTGQDDEPSTGTTIAALPEPVAIPEQQILDRVSSTGGALPDGTPFVVKVEPGLPNEWHGSSAQIVMEVKGEPVSVGVVEFHPAANDVYAFEDGTYRVPAAGHLVTIDFHDHILEELGTEAEKIINTSIRGDTTAGLPVLRLNFPFEWAEDTVQMPTMETRFSTFTVRRGCSTYAAACSDESEVQVIWSPSELSSAPQWRLPQVTVESPEVG